MIFYVIDSSDDCLRIEAHNAEEAVKKAVAEWHMEADAGQRLLAFDQGNAEVFEFAVTVVRSTGASATP